MTVTREAVLAELANVIDPELRRPVTELDMVRALEIDAGSSRLAARVTARPFYARGSHRS